MTGKLTLDRAGRILIAKALRQELHLGSGDTLQLESEATKSRFAVCVLKSCSRRSTAFGLSGCAIRCFNHRSDRPRPGKPYPQAILMKEFFDTSVLVDILERSACSPAQRQSPGRS